MRYSPGSVSIAGAVFDNDTCTQKRTSACVYRVNTSAYVLTWMCAHISTCKPLLQYWIYTWPIDHDSRNKSRRNKQPSCLARELAGTLNNLLHFCSRLRVISKNTLSSGKLLILFTATSILLLVSIIHV